MLKNESENIVGWKDYYEVNGTYGERQGKARYIIEKEFNDTEASCNSMQEGVKWIKDLIDEYKRSFDLAFVNGYVTHIRVPLVEDEDGDIEEDWCGDIDYLEAESVDWSDDEDDDVDDDDDEY